MTRSIAFMLPCALLSCTSPALAQCPAAATAVTAEIGTCAIRLNWSPTVAGTFIQQVLRSESGDTSTAVIQASLIPNVDTFTDQTASRGTRYNYWIRSLPANAAICSPADTQAIAARLPNAGEPPASMTATCAGLVLTANPRFDAISYSYWRWSYGSTGTFDVLAVTTATTFTDTTAEPGRYYEYGIAANGACGSFQGAFTTGAVPIGQPVALPPTNHVVGTSGLPLIIRANISAAAGSDYAWKRDGISLLPDARFSGANSPNLTISPARWEDAGLYTVSVTSACGNAVTAPFPVTIRPGCHADFDQSGAIAPADIFEFLNAWFAGCP